MRTSRRIAPPFGKMRYWLGMPERLSWFTFRENGKEAQAALREALGKYNLRFSVILADPDMAPFRALPEFSQLQTEVHSALNCLCFIFVTASQPAHFLQQY